jgi:hypothetical protein
MENPDEVRQLIGWVSCHATNPTILEIRNDYEDII